MFIVGYIKIAIALEKDITSTKKQDILQWLSNENTIKETAKMLNRHHGAIKKKS